MMTKNYNFQSAASRDRSQYLPTCRQGANGYCGQKINSSSARRCKLSWGALSILLVGFGYCWLLPVAVAKEPPLITKLQISQDDADKDKPTLQTQLQKIVQGEKVGSCPKTSDFTKMRKSEWSVSLVDLTDGRNEYAGHHDTTIRDIASLLKYGAFLTAHYAEASGDIDWEKEEFTGVRFRYSHPTRRAANGNELLAHTMGPSENGTHGHIFKTLEETYRNDTRKRNENKCWVNRTLKKMGLQTPHRAFLYIGKVTGAEGLDCGRPTERTATTSQVGNTLAIAQILASIDASSFFDQSTRQNMQERFARLACRHRNRFAGHFCVADPKSRKNLPRDHASIFRKSGSLNLRGLNYQVLADSILVEYPSNSNNKNQNGQKFALVAICNGRSCKSKASELTQLAKTVDCVMKERYKNRSGEIYLATDKPYQVPKRQQSGTR